MLKQVRILLKPRILFPPLAALLLAACDAESPAAPAASEAMPIEEAPMLDVSGLTATALRALRKVDAETTLAKNHDLSSLRTLFVAGERCELGDGTPAPVEVWLGKVVGKEV